MVYIGTSSPGGIIAYRAIPVLDRWLADDTQIVNLSLHKQMFQMVQMVKSTDVKGVELIS